MNSIPLVEIVVVAVKFLPSIYLYSKTAGVPMIEYPYLLRGLVPKKIRKRRNITKLPMPISSIENIMA